MLKSKLFSKVLIIKYNWYNIVIRSFKQVFGPEQVISTGDSTTSEKGDDNMRKTFTTPKGLSIVFASLALVLQTLVVTCNIMVYKDSLVEEPV